VDQPDNFEQWLPHLTLGTLVLSGVGMSLALTIIVLMQPRTWPERGEAIKAVCFLAILFRAFFTRFTGIDITPLQDFVFWSFTFAGIAFYVATMVYVWGDFAQLVFRRQLKRDPLGCAMWIGVMILTAIAAIVSVTEMR
jgi:hypothetical protein